MARRARSLDTAESSAAKGDSPQNWTWHRIRQYLEHKYCPPYSQAELRKMEVKWREILTQAGWSVKGE